MLYSFNIYCYFPMVKESVVSGAKLVLEYCERNSKRYVGKEKPPAKLNKHFTFHQGQILGTRSEMPL